MTKRWLAGVVLASLAAVVAGVPSASARPSLVCIAPTHPGDAGKAMRDIDALEFYVDEGNPLQSYSVPFRRIQSDVDAKGHVRNAYGVRTAQTAGATIVFAGATPLSFTVVELGRSYVSLEKNEEETAFMADAVPGIVCYSVSALVD